MFSRFYLPYVLVCLYWILQCGHSPQRRLKKQANGQRGAMGNMCPESLLPNGSQNEVDNLLLEMWIGARSGVTVPMWSGMKQKRVHGLCADGADVLTLRPGLRG